MKHNNPRRQHVELMLDEEENLNLEGSDSEDNRVDGDGNNTTEQRKLGLEIDMIRAREEELGRTRSKKCFQPEMNPQEEQNLLWKNGFKKPA